jgi:hypothetical protein
MKYSAEELQKNASSIVPCNHIDREILRIAQLLRRQQVSLKRCLHGILPTTQRSQSIVRKRERVCAPEMVSLSLSLSACHMQLDDFL